MNKNVQEIVDAFHGPKPWNRKLIQEARTLHFDGLPSSHNSVLFDLLPTLTWRQCNLNMLKDRVRYAHPWLVVEYTLCNSDFEMILCILDCLPYQSSLMFDPTWILHILFLDKFHCQQKISLLRILAQKFNIFQSRPIHTMEYAAALTKTYKIDASIKSVIQYIFVFPGNSLPYK